MDVVLKSLSCDIFIALRRFILLFIVIVVFITFTREFDVIKLSDTTWVKTWVMANTFE